MPSDLPRRYPSQDNRIPVYIERRILDRYLRAAWKPSSRRVPGVAPAEKYGSSPTSARHIGELLPALALERRHPSERVTTIPYFSACTLPVRLPAGAPAHDRDVAV